MPSRNTDRARGKTEERPNRALTDGLIVRVPECHCYGCATPALGLDKNDPAGDLARLGWHKHHRRWHCPRCVPGTEP